MRRWRWALVVCAAAATACGGDGGESSGGGGTGGTGGGSGGNIDLPDYRDSPCWGNAATTDMYNADTHVVEKVTASCRAEGDRARVHVVDSLWESAVTQDQINAFMHRLELVGHAGADDPTLGIIANTEAVFGSADTSAMPDGKMDVFVLDIGGFLADGYMCGWCDYPQIHIDGTKLTPLDGDYALAVTSHEFGHIIHRPKDDDEQPWVDEALGEAAMLVNGYNADTLWLDDFVANPNQDWGPSGTLDVHYGGALVWGAYLYERGGADLLQAIIAQPDNGWVGVQAAFSAVGMGDAKQHYLDMLLSLYLNKPELGYGLATLTHGPVGAVADLTAGMDHTGALQPYGAHFIRISGNGSVQVNLSFTPPLGMARAAVVGGQVTTVDLAAGGTLDLSGSEPAVLVVSAEAAVDYTVSLQ